MREDWKSCLPCACTDAGADTREEMRGGRNERPMVEEMLNCFFWQL